MLCAASVSHAEVVGVTNFRGPIRQTTTAGGTCDHALRSVERVVFTVGENNLRSRKALEKIGAKLKGRIDRPTPDGSPNLLYEIIR